MSVDEPRMDLIGLDADDTLWHCETHFVVTEQRFKDLLSPWLDPAASAERLLGRERSNLGVFGFGVKGFTLSMVETAIEVTEGAIDGAAIQEIIGWGKEMLAHPVELLPDVADTIETLRATGYRLVLVTKGDLFHQESKIAESGLADHFEGIEILSDKTPDHYRRVVRRYGVEAERFVMVGNSVKSDVLPVLDIGGRGVHIPYHLTWAHEQHDPDTAVGFPVLGSIGELPDALARLSV